MRMPDGRTAAEAVVDSRLGDGCRPAVSRGHASPDPVGRHVQPAAECACSGRAARWRRLGVARPPRGAGGSGRCGRRPCRVQLGRHLAARLPAIRAAGLEPAGGRQVERRRHHAVDRRQPSAALLDGRDRLDQAHRVRHPGIDEDLVDGPLLHDLAGVHDDHVVDHLGDHAEVVGDQHQRGARPLLDRLEQLQDLRLDRHVERGRRLVGDQQLRLARERHPDHHALAHAAGQLVRVLLRTPLRAR